MASELAHLVEGSVGVVGNCGARRVTIDFWRLLRLTEKAMSKTISFALLTLKV